MKKNQANNFAGQKKLEIQRYSASSNPDSAPASALQAQAVSDVVAVESPLEIRVVFSDGDKRKDRSLSITMRTPGDDQHLAAGFLLSEGIVDSPADIAGFETCGPVSEGESTSNQLRVNLAEGFNVDTSRLQRHFYTTSSCGVCGKASLDAVEAQNVQPITDDTLRVSPAVILSLPGSLREGQAIFGTTGGLHAAGRMSSAGSLQHISEDVGRHNAVDKLIGRAFVENQMPLLTQSVLAVSGRASFELVQKAVVARISMMVAVGAPSSLAVDLAERFGLTLIGFNSGKKFNVYTHPHRVG